MDDKGGINRGWLTCGSVENEEFTFVWLNHAYANTGRNYYNNARIMQEAIATERRADITINLYTLMT